jgi:hypothetical protein
VQGSVDPKRDVPVADLGALRAILASIRDDLALMPGLERAAELLGPALAEVDAAEDAWHALGGRADELRDQLAELEKRLAEASLDRRRLGHAADRAAAEVERARARVDRLGPPTGSTPGAGTPSTPAPATPAPTGQRPPRRRLPHRTAPAGGR